MPTTLWQLGVYMAMIAIGGGLMFKGLKGSGGDDSQANPQSSGPDNTDVLQELAELRAKVDRMNQLIHYQSHNKTLTQSALAGFSV